ncbi:MAG: PfkB family carbohydrate kinase [Vicinamibacteria bacterium]
MAILVVGSVAFDDLKTPTRNADGVIGGAATYFALSASFFTEVNVVAVVGDDFTERERKIFEGRPVDISGLETAPGKTFRWGGEYSADLTSRTTLFTDLGVFERFQPTIPAHFRESSFVFLANIHPTLQVEVMKQVSSPRLIGADTMNYWIERTPSELAEMLSKIDVLVINDEEARQLAAEHNLVKAAARIRSMGPSTLVIKRGEYGVLCFRANERFATVSFPLETVVDPTGAGDSFAGGFMGYLATREVLDDQAVRQAIIFGSVLGSFSVEDLGTDRLARLTREEVYDRYQEFKTLTDFQSL